LGQHAEGIQAFFEGGLTLTSATKIEKLSDDAVFGSTGMIISL